MTVKKFFAEVVSDLRIPENTKIYQDRFEITNRAVEAVTHHFYHLMAGHYHTNSTVTVTNGEVDVSSIAIMPGIFEKGTVLIDGNDIFSPTSVNKYHILINGLFDDMDYRIFTKVGNKLLVNAEDTGEGDPLKIFYYRQPSTVSLDTHDLDVPAGAAIDLAISKAKSIVQERIGIDSQVNVEAIRDQIARLSEQYNHAISQEQLDEKVQAFI